MARGRALWRGAGHCGAEPVPDPRDVRGCAPVAVGAVADRAGWPVALAVLLSACLVLAAAVYRAGRAEVVGSRPDPPGRIAP